MLQKVKYPIHPYVYAGLSTIKQRDARLTHYRAKAENIFDLTRMIAEYLNVSLTQLKDATRTRKVSEARMFIMYYAKEVYHLSWTAIGSFFNRDHSTAIYGYNTMKGLLKYDKRIIAIGLEIDKLLQR